MTSTSSPKRDPVVINCKNTQYAVVARMSKTILGWRVSNAEPETKEKSHDWTVYVMKIGV